MPAPMRARRMSPADRREQILDSAVELIVARGLSSCSLDEVAVQAQISKPLIYKYFPKREDLLKEMLEREYRYLRGRGLDEIPADVPLDEVIRISHQRAIEYLYERGPIMRLLASDRSVMELVQSRDRDERLNITRYFVRRNMESYGMSEEVALICATMSVNAPILSARALKRQGVTAKRLAEVWSEFILGGIKAVQTRFGSSAPKSARKKSKSR